MPNALFTLDSLYPKSYVGAHDPADHWNGWAKPAFVPSVVALIMADINGDPTDDVVLAWDGATLVVDWQEGADTVQRIEPGPDGTYRFDGWTWQEYTPDEMS